MKTLIIASPLALAAVGLNPVQAQESDSVRLAQLEEVSVKGVRAQQNAPFAVANIGKRQLNTFSKSGQELPFLFAQTPGVLAWGENGLGTGTTYMRIRGAAGSRINVTLDGVALNSPEDQTVFWANMNSYAALLGSAQIQRGIGTSTNGDGAFGGSISLATAAPSETPSLELTGSYGSYNTYNIGTTFSTGLLLNHLIFEGAYHETATDGYLHGTSGRSGSYYGSLTWLGQNFTLRYKNLGNFEKTGQAWNGVVTGNDDATLMDKGIRTYKDMVEAGLGKYNDLYEQIAFDDNAWAFARNADGNYYANRLSYLPAPNGLWSKTTDNFYQNHNILSASWKTTAHWSHNAALHYTYGYGYYKQLRPQYKFSKFGITATDFEGNEVKRADFVRRKGLTQHTYGLVYTANYVDQLWDILGGVNLQNFDANHFGYLDYISTEYENRVVNLSKQWEGNQYYDSDADKNDYSAYIKATRHLSQQWDAFADVQFRRVDYATNGLDDKFLKQANGLYANQRLDISKHYNFLNPKAGLAFHQGGHKAYASVAYASREPERNNFTDNVRYPDPKAEHLADIELGYSYQGSNWSVGLNAYYMDYKDQLVQTGEQSDIGENLTTNIDKSYRMGLELTADWTPLSWLTLAGNAALSKNKINDFTEYVDNWGGDPIQVHYSSSTLAFSPSAILNGFLTIHTGGLRATWHTNFVSRQYLDNTACTARSLPCFSQTNLHADYTFNLGKQFAGLKQLILGFSANNIFSRHYATSGWTYSAVSEIYGYSTDDRYNQIGFIPAAGFHCMGNITLRF